MTDLEHREAGTPGDPAVLLVHGYPESSYMWREILPALAAAGHHAVAPDLAGYGDSEPEALIALRWACEHPDAGHCVVADAPDRYAEELARFLKRARPGTAR